MTPREQERMRALAYANEIRHERAELKRRLASGRLSVADVLLEPPLAVLSWPVAQLLLSQPRWGKAKCQKFLSHNQIGELRRVGALTDRQRRLLAAQLPGGPPFVTPSAGCVGAALTSRGPVRGQPSSSAMPI